MKEIKNKLHQMLKDKIKKECEKRGIPSDEHNVESAYMSITEFCCRHVETGFEIVGIPRAKSRQIIIAAFAVINDACNDEELIRLNDEYIKEGE